MADELDNAIAACLRLISQIDGIRLTYDEPPSRFNASHDAVVMGYAPSGTWNSEAEAEVKGLHNVQIGVYVARKEGELARAIAKVKPFGEKVKDKLYASAIANAQWHDADGNATIDTINGEITYTFGPVPYDDKELFGWTFTIPIKIKSRETSTGVYAIANS